jgi:parallel beta-helix repeat protein
MKRRSAARPVLVGLAGACAAFALASGAGAKTIEVSEGQSIQAAVNQAAPGDTILVKAGVYKENVVVTTSNLTIQGQNAVLAVPDHPTPTTAVPCAVDKDHLVAVNGFCATGDVDLDTATVNSYVEGVTIRGFQVSGFPGSGIVAFGAKGAVFEQNRAVDNEEYGIAAFVSTGTQVLDNSSARAGEAGIYIGDSPEARALVDGNRSTDNSIGIFVRDALKGTIRNNRVTGNCIGVFFLADAPGPAGQMTVAKNRISKNTKACPANEEEQQPPISGLGVAISGANGVVIKKNSILDNKPGGETVVSGGVVIAKGDGGTAPKNNIVMGNLIRRNTPDLQWDKTGTGNVFRNNSCGTSKPRGLCR